MRHVLIPSLLCWFALSAAHAGQVEVLHWWTSGSEARAAAILQQHMEQQGYQWRDFAIAGGGGQSAMTVLRSRAVAGTPPSAALLKGPSVSEWGKLGFLTNLDELAEQQQWPQILPEIALELMRYNQQVVAVPVNIHQVNWLWINAKLLRQAGKTPPRTLAELFELAEALQQQGIIAIAHGNQPWQNVTLFESLALANLGPEHYRRAFVSHQLDATVQQQLQQSFAQLRRLKQYMSLNNQALSWSDASAQLIRGEAAMQFSGDWVKGELYSAQLSPGTDYYCVPAPGTQQWFSYNIDSFVFFKLKGRHKEADQQAQQALARTLLDAHFQQAFNQVKGSLPVRMDLPLQSLDSCSRDSAKSFLANQANHQLVPSFSQGIAYSGQLGHYTSSYAAKATEDLVHEFFNDDAMSPEQAVAKLTKLIQAQSLNP